MTIIEDVVIEEFHNQLSISRTDVRIILFLQDQIGLKKFQSKYNLNEEQVSRSIERLIFAGFAKNLGLTSAGRDICKKIKERIKNLEQYN